MAQSEDKKRLLLNKTIVGYEWKHYDDFLECVITEYMTKDNKLGLADKPDHDSFNSGIKHNGKWFFEGDEFMLRDSNFNEYTLVWKNFIPEFQEDGNDSMIALPQRWDNMEYIGNIYNK